MSNRDPKPPGTEGSAFPIEIEYQDTGELLVCFSLRDIESGRPFVVLNKSPEDIMPPTRTMNR